MKFIDDNCGCFEDAEENKLEYTLIHNAFKQLVDDLLAAHLSELQVSVEQFTHFCANGLTGDNPLHSSLCEQLLSVDDFLVFKALMVKHNADLQRETLAAMAMATAPRGGGPGSFEEQIEAAAEKAEQYEAEKRCLEAELQLAMALALQLEKKLKLIESLNEIVEALTRMEAESMEAATVDSVGVAKQKHMELEPLLPPEMQLAPLRQNFSSAGTGGTGGLGSAPPMSGVEKMALERTRADAALRREQAKDAAAQPAASMQRAGPTEEDKRARADHLKRQRELLMEKKNRDRHEQLTTHQQTYGSTTAARVAERACARGEVVLQPPSDAGKLLAAELAGLAQSNATVGAIPDPEAAAIEMRKALTRQLKQTLTQSS